MAVLVVLVAILHLLGAGPLRASFWGVHQYGFFAPLLLAAATLGLLVSLLVLRIPPERWSTWLAKSPGQASWPARRNPALDLALAAGVGVMFWLMRIRHTFLGDATMLLVNVPRGESFHSREPLTAVLQQGIHRLFTPLFTAAGQDALSAVKNALALGSVLAGAVFVLVALGLARELARLRPAVQKADTPADPGTGVMTALLGLILLSQGYVLLFCGYVENYTFFAVSLGLYLWLALRYLRGVGSLVWPAMGLLLAVTLHLSAAILAPSFLVLVSHGFRQPRNRGGIWRDLGLSLLVVIAALMVLWVLGSRYSLLGTLAEVARQALTREQENAPDYLLSWLHVRNFINHQLLIGPLGLLLFLPAAGATLATRSAGKGAGPFLLVAGACYLGASWLAGESNLGYPRNWDLLAPGGLVFAVAGLGLYLAMARKYSSLIPVLAVAAVLSLYHTVPWIAVNASLERSLARLMILPIPGGQGQVNVARWYYQQENFDQAKNWTDQALQVNPRNNNALFMYGLLAEREGDYTTAAEAFGRAVALRSYKTEYRERLARALLRSGDSETAAKEYEILLTTMSNRHDLWGLYCVALQNAQHFEQVPAVLARIRKLPAPDDPQAAQLAALFTGQGHLFRQKQQWARAAEMYREALVWQPHHLDTMIYLGVVSMQNGDVQAGLAAFTAALEIAPESARVHFNLGLALTALGRDEAARPHLEAALAGEPAHPRAARIRELLGLSSHRKAGEP